jgi:fumarate reductase flavoprotein subunit
LARQRVHSGLVLATQNVGGITRRGTLVIAGGGMAGLVAAARARELGAEPVVYEKGTRAGGSMLLSSGFAWRYRSLDVHLEQCPEADEALARTIVERFDDSFDWLESIGVELLTRETGNPLTTGGRFHPSQLVETLGRDVRLEETTDEPAILATGGFPARLAREKGLMLRGNPWSEGDGLEHALARGGVKTGDEAEFYGRAMPAVAEIAEEDFVRLTQLYGRFATVTSKDGTERFDGPPSWSEVDLVQRISAWPGGLAWYSVDRSDLEQRVRERTVGEMIDAAREAGAPVHDDGDRIRVLVRASVTQTIGGIRIDEKTRVLAPDGGAIDGLYSAGVDAGGWATGGYASGLSAALVFGKIAAESALGH